MTRKSDRLDNMEREEWARTLKKQREMRKQALEVVDELAERKSIRLRRRTPSEEMEVLQSRSVIDYIFL